MTVHETGYQPYSGGRLGPLRRMLAITGVGIRIGLRRRFLVTAMLMAVPMTFMFGVLFYIAADNPGQFVERARLFFTPEEWHQELGGSGYETLSPSDKLGTLWSVLLSRHLYYQMLWVLVVIPWAGPSLLADDFQSRALTIYFSKPITRFEYLLGKWMVLGFFVGCVTAVPSTLLYIASILMCRDLEVLWRTAYLVPAAWFVSLLVAVTGGLMMMAFSAAGRSRRFAALGWLMTVMGSWVVATAVELAPREHAPTWVKVLSFKHNVDLVTRSVFGVMVQPIDVSVFWSLGMLLAVGMVSGLYLWRRVHTVEGLR